MRRVWVVLAVVLLVGVGVGAAVWNRPAEHVNKVNEPVKVKAPLENVVVADKGDFGFEMFKQLARAEKDGNVFISPTSVFLALSMTYNGASGETREAMAQALGLKGMSLEELNRTNKALLDDLNDPMPDVEMSVANSLWARQGVVFDESFLQRNRDHYDARVTSLDFSRADAPDIINSWVEDKTRGKITDLIDATSDDAVLYLVNAVYFKGKWSIPFMAREKQDIPFNLAGGRTKRVQVMLCKHEYDYLSQPGFQAIRLPYGDGRLGMYVFLPGKESNLSKFYKELTYTNWKRWLAKFKMVEGDILLPRFKMEYEIELSDVLSSMGMGIAFTPVKADFRAMSSESGVCIDNVKHKAFIEVDEEGTEAAAATAVEMWACAAEDSFTMVVDRPFFIAIADNKSDEVLFMGAVNEPE